MKEFHFTIFELQKHFIFFYLFIFDVVLIYNTRIFFNPRGISSVCVIHQEERIEKTTNNFTCRKIMIDLGAIK